MPKPYLGMVASSFFSSALLMLTFCSTINTAMVIITTLGLQNWKYSSMSLSVDSGSAAAALNPV